MLDKSIATDIPNEIEFLFSLLKPLVKKSDEIKVHKATDDMGVLLSVSVHPDDMGCVIGKGGEIAMSIRTIMRAYGLTHGMIRVAVKILDPKESSNPRVTGSLNG